MFGPQYYIIASIIAIVCLFFVVLYTRYQSMREQRKLNDEEALIREGEKTLDEDYFDGSGTMNPTPYVFDETAFEDDDDGETKQQESASNEAAAATAPGEVAREAAGEGADASNKNNKKKKEKGVVDRVVDSIKSGKLLKTINRFAVRTNQLSERIAAKDTSTEEEKLQRERFGRLSDDAVNPLFPLRVAKIKKEQEEHEQRKAETQRRNAAAATLLGVPAKTQQQQEQNGEQRSEKQAGEELVEKEQKETKSSGIYQFNAEQLQQLSNVMSASATKSIDAVDKTGRKEYLGQGGVDGAVQGAFQTDATRRV